MDGTKLKEQKLNFLLTKYELTQEKIVSKTKFMYQILGALGAANLALLGYAMANDHQEICLLVPFIILFGTNLFLMELNGRVRLDNYISFMEYEIDNIIDFKIRSEHDLKSNVPSMRYPIAFALVLLVVVYVGCAYEGAIWLKTNNYNSYATMLSGMYTVSALLCIIYYVKTEPIWRRKK